MPAFAEVVRSVRDEHDAGVLLIDHNMALIMDVCDRIQVLDQGRTLAEGSPSEIRGNLDVAAAYLGESAVASVSDARDPRSRGRLRRRRRPSAACRSSVAPGEIVGLIGPNGAGKSTTLHAIMGLVPARAGEIRLGDASLRGRTPEAIARSGVALVPEGRRLFAELTVEENLRLGLAARRARAGPTRRSPRSPSSSRSCEEFGTGTRARSRAVSSSSSPSRARSSRGRRSSCSTSRRSGSRRRSSTSSSRRCGDRERGIGVLLVEQRAQRTVALAARTHVLANGELRLTLTPDDAADTDRMVAAYLS